MSIIYRTTPLDSNSLTYLSTLGKDDWIYCGQLLDKLVFRKEEKKTRTIKESNLSGFEQWYTKYPNKKSRKDAEIMWNRLNEGERELAFSGIQRYILYWKKKGMDKQFMPHPATWLHGKRWEDDLSETVNIQPTKSEEIVKKEQYEQRKNEEEKRKLDARILKCKSDPVEWKRINELAYSQLTKEQRESTVKDSLLQVRIRMILSEYL